ncbi:uncharacterized protein ATC70_004705 [Mucor velutinosus]|uniref:Uncharacterized protein n=1 Tax=Mucor velutinosus TaxID=708070 RepID=A0AAN7HQK8_9FUNG|nr:hypothetical protein ATC70_004705 [Mucor velutinosus]
MDRETETITVSGETIVIPGENRTLTEELEYTPETYTTTITNPSTYISTYTTTRLLQPVYTLIGEDTTIKQTFGYTEPGVPIFFTAQPNPEPALAVTETVIE